MSLYEKQMQFAMNVSKLLVYIHSIGFGCTFGEAYRTPEQAKIDAQKGTGIVDSLHCKRLAVDLNLFDKAGNYLSDTLSYKPMGDYWVSLHDHNRWGGSFSTRKDGNHFEMQDI